MLTLSIVRSMSTRAIKFLKQKKIAFEVMEYDHQEKGAEFASQAIGFPLNQTIKTLVAETGPKGHALVLMPGDKNLSFKKLAKAVGVKRTAMADIPTAERLTGYMVGGISPFGTKRRLQVIMEKNLLKYDRIAINAGQRGIMLIMNPKDIVSVVEAKLDDLIE